MKQEEKDEVQETNMGFSRQPISITLPETLIEAVEYLAKQQKRNRSNMIEVLISHGLVAEATERNFTRRADDKNGVN